MKQAHNSLQVGDVVLIKEDLPRGKWKVGVIHELVRGKDHMIWLARVLISSNKCLHRALSLLYPTECPKTKRIILELKSSLLCLITTMKMMMLILLLVIIMMK